MITMLNYLGVANRGVRVQWFFMSAVARDVVVLALMALVLRDVLQPDQDVVRTSWPGVDDPAGGVLDGAADAATQRSSGSHRDRLPRVDSRLI